MPLKSFWKCDLVQLNVQFFLLLSSSSSSSALKWLKLTTFSKFFFPSRNISRWQMFLRQLSAVSVLVFSVREVTQEAQVKTKNHCGSLVRDAARRRRRTRPPDGVLGRDLRFPPGTRVLAGISLHPSDSCSCFTSLQMPGRKERSLAPTAVFQGLSLILSSSPAELVLLNRSC